MEEIIYSGIVSVVTAIITWFLARKKYYSEVDNNYIENMKKSLEFYEKLADDNSKRLEILSTRNSKLEEEIIDLRKQIIKLTNDVNTLRLKDAKNDKGSKGESKANLRPISKK